LSVGVWLHHLLQALDGRLRAARAGQNRKSKCQRGQLKIPFRIHWQTLRVFRKELAFSVSKW
jgi:hypothetical protein